MTVKSSLRSAALCAALGMLPMNGVHAQQTTRDTTTAQAGTTTGKTGTTTTGSTGTTTGKTGTTTGSTGTTTGQAGTTATPKAEKLKFKSDAELTNQVRKAIQNDKSLATVAQKIQITTKARYVTLKGTVQTAEEKNLVEARAADVAGDDFVVSELAVAKPVASRGAAKK